MGSFVITMRHMGSTEQTLPDTHINVYLLVLVPGTCQIELVAGSDTVSFMQHMQHRLIPAVVNVKFLT